MSAPRIFLNICLLTASLAMAAPSWAAASDDSKAKAPLSLEEIAARRKTIREELMMPSLAGIRNISYRVVGYKNFEPLDKLMGSKLAQLNVSATPLVQIKDEQKPFDALVQISFAKSGNNTIAELKVTQWVSLLRNSKLAVRAVTYSDKAYLPGNKAEQAVEQLTNEFVVDFLKANQKGFDAEKPGKAALSSAKAASSTKK